MKTEFDMGLDNPNNLFTFMDSVKGCCDCICLINKGICLDPIISDNILAEYTEITNTTLLVQSLVDIYKRIGYQYKMAFVPMADKYHSKQRLVETICSFMPVTVIEISCKETRKFYIDNTNDISNRCSIEDLCEMIQEEIMVDENGNTYGSGDIFR